MTGAGKAGSVVTGGVKPTIGEVERYMAAVSRVVPFFPQDDIAVKLISAAVFKFVGTLPQLEWFAAACVDRLGKYDGVPALRALFCSRYNPADGVAPMVDVEGLEAEALENEYQKRVMEENERRMESYRREALLAPPEDREPFLLPESQAMPVVDEKITAAARSLTAGEQLAIVGASVRCSWCAEGYARVRSSVSANFIHTDTPVGRVVCKNRSADGAIDPAPGQTPPVDADASRTLDGGSAS
jgi:hypothetical protein